MQQLIAFLIWALILVIVLFVVKIILGMFELPEPIKKIVWLIIGLIVLVLVLSALGGFLPINFGSFGNVGHR